MTLAQIESEIDKLPPEKFEELYDYISERRLITNHDLAWGEEASRRYNAYKSGKTSARPVEDVVHDLRSRFS